MFRYVYNSIYMLRMLKDKLYDSAMNYYYNTHINKVDRMNPSNSLLTDIYNLSYGMDHIKDYIYIGNAYVSSNYYILRENNIGLVVNVTEEIPNYYEDFEDGFDYLRINIRDQNNESIFETLEDTLHSIHNYRLEHPDKNILIHCYMGSSRSATIICAYLIQYYNFTVSQSIKLLKDTRDIVNINTSFISDLKRFYNTIHNNTELKDSDETCDENNNINNINNICILTNTDDVNNVNNVNNICDISNISDVNNVNITYSNNWNRCCEWDECEEWNKCYEHEEWITSEQDEKNINTIKI